MKITWDIEANNLLNDESIDYNSRPYKLKDSFKLHCIVIEDHESSAIHAFYDGDFIPLDGTSYKGDGEYTTDLDDYQPVVYIHHQLKDFPEFIKTNNIEKAVAHNSIDYDHLVTKLYYGMDYNIAYYKGDLDNWGGVDLVIEDTLVTSKTLNPDRFGGHSLDNLGKLVGLNKIEFRKNIIESKRFERFAPDMLYYCIRDVQVNTKVYSYLENEKGGWNWEDSIHLEKAVAELVTRQSHRGFNFNVDLAEKCIPELDGLMLEAKDKVEPVLPMKTPTKGFQKDVTPPVRQFIKDGSLSSYLKKYIDKHNGELVEIAQTGLSVDDYKLRMFGKEWDFPLEIEPMVDEVPCTIDDTTEIKEWLVSLGWIPSEWNERDITMYSDKRKGKLPYDKFVDTVNNYVDKTLNSPLKDERCDHLNVKPSQLKNKLMKMFDGRSIKVITNPKFTKGQEKEICPNLEKLSEDFPYAKDIVNYLTYKHRRNSILGGGLEWEEGESADKGYLAHVRSDGRIPTPADTCGAATSRMTHRIVANIPRVTSLYGDKMRALFGTDDEFWQIGYDFDSLEAKIEADAVYKYKGGKEYGESLTAEKPNDCHSVLARKLTEILGYEFPRGSAKPVKYGCLPTDNTEVLTSKGWAKFEDIKVGDSIIGYDQFNDRLSTCSVTKTYHYKDAEVVDKGHSLWSMESTRDHRWYGKRLKNFGKGKNGIKIWQDSVATTDDLKQTFNITNTAPFIGNEDCSVLPVEAELVGWLLSDGYYKWSDKKEVTSSSNGAKKGIVSVFTQSDNKFWKEMERCLDKNGIDYVRDISEQENGNHVYKYRPKAKCMRDFLDRVVGCRRQKHDVDWTGWVMSLDRDCLTSFVHSFWLADGDVKNKEEKIYMTFKQNDGNIQDALMLAGYLLGYNVTRGKKGKCKGIRFQKVRRHTTTQEFKEKGLRTTDVFCLSTTLDTFVVKQNDIITITGNCSYNAQPPRVAKTIGCDLNTGQIIFDAFWEQAAPLKALKEKMIRYWETTGQKKFLLGLDGRKLPVRAKGNVINTRFQSSGVICAKRAAVIHDRKLKEEGYYSDIFKDDWTGKVVCNQLIMYHDEAQLEVSRKDVKFKMFKTKEEAEQYKEDIETSTNKMWSDVGHSPKGYYVAYSRAGELALEAVKEAGEYYNLNIDLTAGYMVGNSWASCH